MELSSDFLAVINNLSTKDSVWAELGSIKTIISWLIIKIFCLLTKIRFYVKV